jgi:hypothetical protein
MGDDPDVANTLRLFSQQAQIVSLSIRGEFLSPSHLYASLPYLRTLKLSHRRLHQVDLSEMQEAASLLPRLHTVNIVYINYYGELESWLHAMRTFRSLRSIRIRKCFFPENEDRTNAERVESWYSGEYTIPDLTISDSPELEFLDCASPFL